MKVEDWEELSAKVRSDLIQLQHLEAEVNRLKKFEEANTRLRKYNGELRRTIVMTQAESSGQNHPVIQIPEGEEGHDELVTNNESVDVCQNRSSNAVVSNSLVLDVIFKMMDMEDVKNCRLICRKWNDNAYRILFKPNKSLPVHLDLGNTIEEPDEIVAAMNENVTRIQALHSVVATSPEDWFKRAYMDRSFLQRAEIQSILQDFGYRLRTIKTTGPTFLFQDIRNILVEWCPNLEKLSFSRLTVEAGEDILESGYQKLIFPRPLKLMDLCMTTFCVEIIKASPELMILSCDSDENNLQLFKEFKTCPEITKNLEEMTLYIEVNEDIDTMGEFKSVQFSNKLKTLTVLCCCNGVFQARELSEILEKVGEALEKLIFTITLFPPIPDPSLLTFPVMNNLKELRFLAHRGIPINSIEFLTDMPNLKVLYLGRQFNYPSAEEDEPEDFIDNFFLISNCQQLRRRPHTNLKELYLFGIVKHPSRTFEMMNQTFPNVTTLVVGLFKASILLIDDPEMTTYYEEAFQGLSEIHNLKKLYLDFRNTGQEQTEWQGISFPFDYLSTLSNLDHLTVRNDSGMVTLLDVDMTEKLLVELRNLRRVTLIGISLDLLTGMRLVRLLSKHNIDLELKDEDVKEDFRVHNKKDFEI